jgi:hypothetical protein
MKTITLAAIAAVFAGLALAAGAGATTAKPAIPTIQPSCPEAPAVARSYLKDQAGRQLTMSRADVIAAITKLTGPDGEFAGLKPCDAGYASAVHFYIDEVLKAGTDNTTPQG